MSHRAVVLGAREGSSNIGEACATELQLRGWNVVQDDCYMGQDARPAYQPPVGTIYEGADALVISLGKTSTKPFRELPGYELQEVIYGSLILPLRCAQMYLRRRQDQGGRIVFIGSYAHRHPFTNGTAYCAAKAGLHMAAQTLGWEFTDKGFRTFIVHPYHVEGTPMWEDVQRGVVASRGWDREQADEYARQNLKMPAPLTPDTVAKTVADLIMVPHMGWQSGTAVELFGGTR